MISYMGRLFSFSVIGALFFSSTLFAGGRLVVPSEGVSFGEVVAGETASASVALRNEGTEPLVFAAVVPCCGLEARLGKGTLPFSLAPAAEVRLRVTWVPSFPGAFKKQVELMSDDPILPCCVVPVTGFVVEPSVAQMRARRFTPLAVVVAGFVDGFNPCAFSIVIVLAGLLAVGGRHRTARLVGGLAFCVGSFATYVLMGLGLLHVGRFFTPLTGLRDAMRAALSLSLFVLSFLSLRDAFCYRKTGDARTIALQLPAGVKRLIRLVAERCWRVGTDASAAKGRGALSLAFVGMTSLGCGFLVTLLDALCTGQIYVPVLALLSREPAAEKAFIYLILYNLAFILPLVFVFIVAAHGVDSARLQRWSKRNVVPSKIALAMIFALLGVLIMPSLGAYFAHLF